METRSKVILVGVVAGLVATGTGVLLFLEHGVSARDEPTRVEVLAARTMRHFAVPGRARAARNPLPPTAEVVAGARAHFADHCASCHGNDGHGKTALGQNLYPKAPDMWLAETQSLPDGELFWIIKNGIRPTGMAAWGKDTPDDDRETWALVHFIRHLPQLTPAELKEMEDLNPRGPGEWKEEEEAKKFLEGG